MHRLATLDSSHSTPGGGIYTPQASNATYRLLCTLARDVLRAGFHTIVDATFLKRSDREAFRLLAEETGAQRLILNFEAPVLILRGRIEARQKAMSDASEADIQVLERQIAARESLAIAELEETVTVDASRAFDSKTWRPLMARLGQG
jgi:predicted kinase